MNIYQTHPTFITPRFTLRLVEADDAPGLLSVYSDRQAQAYFNADNCTSNFRYTTLRQMQECVDMWIHARRQGWFMRWVILEKELYVGTVEMFRQSDGPDGQGRGVLRMDVLSRKEFEDVFDELLRTMLPGLHDMFGCREIVTKAPRFAIQRQTALRWHGFVPLEKPLEGKDGRMLPDYWVRRASK